MIDRRVSLTINSLLVNNGVYFATSPLSIFIKNDEAMYKKCLFSKWEKISLLRGWSHVMTNGGMLVWIRWGQAFS